MKKTILLFMLIIFCMAGCADSQPSQTATVQAEETVSSGAADSQTQTAAAAPVSPDCSSDQINTLGSQAAYLLSGGRFTEQGGFVYYFSGGEQPGLYKQREKENLILQDELFREASYLNIIGAKLYFISGGKAYEIYTDSTGLKELFEAEALVAWEDKLYYIDADGFKSYDAVNGSVLIMAGDFSQIFVQFGQLFITRENTEYGTDLLVCSNDKKEARTVIEGCAFLLCDGHIIYAETSSGIYTADGELSVTEHTVLTFDLVPAAAAAYNGNIYYCDRRDEKNIYITDLEGNRQMFFNRPADYMWIYSDRLVYESKGQLMTVNLDGTDNKLLSEGFGSDENISVEISGALSIEGIGNEALKTGQSKEVTFLLDGLPVEEQGLSVQQVFEGIKLVNTDNLIARLIYKDGKLFVEALAEGSTVLKIEAGEHSVEYLIRVVSD